MLACFCLDPRAKSATDRTDEHTDAPRVQQTDLSQTRVRQRSADAVVPTQVDEPSRD